MKKDRGEKRLKNKKLMHVVRVKACSPNLLQKKKNNRANKSTEKENVVVVTVQGGNTDGCCSNKHVNCNRSRIHAQCASCI